MSKLKHPIHEQHVVFVTTTCFDKSPFFQLPPAAELVIEQINRLRGNGIWLVPEFVVMPAHVHLIQILWLLHARIIEVGS